MLKNKLWVKCKLGEIAQLKNGYAFKSEEYKNEGIPIIRISDIKDGSVLIENSKLINQSLEFENYTIESGDILIAMSGATTGKFGIYNSTKKAYQNQRVGNLKPILETATDKIFLFYLLYSLKRQIEKDAYGGAQPNISSTKVEDIEIEYPPLNEQHRIVVKIEELFSELDQGIDNLKTAQAQLKVYRQALLKHAFEGKLTAEWRAQNADKLESASALQQRIQHAREQRYQQQLAEWQTNGKQGSKPKAPKPITPITAEELAELPELPEGWDWMKSGEFFESVTSGSRGWADYYADSGAVFLRITNLDFDTLELDLESDKVQYVQPPSGAEGLRTKVKEGDFLFSITGYLGMFAIAPALEEAYVNQHISLARPLNEFSKQYFGYYVTSHTGGMRYLNNQTKGAVKAGLGLDDIQNFPVPICSLSEQMKIAEELKLRLSGIDQLDQTITTSLQQAEALRQSILKKAFSGELVPQDPNDEPASALLARIQAEKAEHKTKHVSQGQAKNAYKTDRYQTRSNP